MGVTGPADVTILKTPPYLFSPGDGVGVGVGVGDGVGVGVGVGSSSPQAASSTNAARSKARTPKLVRRNVFINPSLLNLDLCSPLPDYYYKIAS